MQSIEVYNMTLKEQETYESLSEKTEMQIKTLTKKLHTISQNWTLLS